MCSFYTAAFAVPACSLFQRRRIKEGVGGKSRSEARPPKALIVEAIDEDFAIFVWEDAPDPADDVQLTKAEREVLHQVVQGASNAAIAKQRGSSIRTVANQVAKLLKKLGASSRFDLIRRYAHRAGAKA
jgi:DNA-binding CsgD family transcriptional regulator